jgi:hypothetical protein
MDQMPSTSGINTNINRASQVMDNAQTSAMHASTSTSEPRQTPVSCTGASERNTLRQLVPSEHNRAEAIHGISIMHSGAVSSFGATGPGPSQIPESDAQTTSNTQGRVISVGGMYDSSLQSRNMPDISMGVPHPVSAGICQSVNEPETISSMHDPVSAHIPLKIKENIWRGEFVQFGVLLKSAKELATDSLFDGDLVLKGGSLTVVNKKPDTVPNIESWTTAFVIYMDILLEKWPFRAREYLIYMQNIRLAASSCQNNGWLVYDEQYRLKKARFPFSSWGVIDQELWILCVTTSNLSNTMDANRNSGKEPFSENSVHFKNYLSHQPFQFRSGSNFGRTRQTRC